MSGRRPERPSTRVSRRGTRRRGGAKVSQTSKNVLVIERRVLIGVTLFTLLGSVLWIVSISTDYWFAISVPTEDGIYAEETNSYLLSSHVGLWRVCRTEKFVINNVTNETALPSTRCRNFNMFPTRVEVERTHGEVDYTILDYQRTATAFAIIGMILMIMGHGFSCYTFIEQRYMFKRLAGGIHFITAASTIVVIEVTSNAAKYSASHLTARHPAGSSWGYGFSFGVGWISFITFLVAGIAFIACSKKRKGMRLPNELAADAPNILGRA